MASLPTFDYAHAPNPKQQGSADAIEAVGQDVLGMTLAVFCGISRRQHDSWQELVTLGATYFVAEARVVRAR